jgi:hypothetical protein
MFTERLFTALIVLSAPIIIFSTAGGGCRKSSTPKSVSSTSNLVYYKIDQGVVVPVNQPVRRASF